MKDVQIKFSSDAKQFDHEEQVTYLCDGIMFELNGYTYLEYDEHEENRRDIETLVKFNDSHLQFIRKGDSYQKLDFVDGSEASGLYVTQMGEFNLTTFTNKLITSPSEIHLEYLLYMDEQEAGTYTIKLQIMEDNHGN